MMIVNIVTMLCVTFSLLLTINATSIHDHHQLQVVFHELASRDYQQLDHHPALPRKLMVNNKKGEDYEAKGLVSSNEQNKPYSGNKSQNGEEVVKARVHGAAKGTRQEWLEGSDDPTHDYFFTMDYSHVRRRRPIHNKSSPMTVATSP